MQRLELAVKTSFNLVYWPFFNVILCSLLNTWSGRPGSNRRRPAWEEVGQLYLKHLFVSETLIRLTQALAVSTTSLLEPPNRGTNEVHPNVLLASVNLRNILWAGNTNGSRYSASHCRFWPKGCLACSSKLGGQRDVPRLYLDYKVAERKSLIQQVLA